MDKKNEILEYTSELIFKKLPNALTMNRMNAKTGDGCESIEQFIYLNDDGLAKAIVISISSKGIDFGHVIYKFSEVNKLIEDLCKHFNLEIELFLNTVEDES